MPKSKKGRGPYRRDGRALPRSDRTPAPHFIKSYRLKRGLTLEQLAELAGLSTGSISAIERQEQEPSMQTLQALAHALKAKRGDLLDVDPGPTGDAQAPQAAPQRNRTV